MKRMATMRSDYFLEFKICEIWTPCISYTMLDITKTIVAFNYCYRASKILEVVSKTFYPYFQK